MLVAKNMVIFTNSSPKIYFFKNWVEIFFLNSILIIELFCFQFKNFSRLKIAKKFFCLSIWCRFGSLCQFMLLKIFIYLYFIFIFYIFRFLSQEMKRMNIILILCCCFLGVHLANPNSKETEEERSNWGGGGELHTVQMWKNNWS